MRAQRDRALLDWYREAWLDGPVRVVVSGPPERERICSAVTLLSASMELVAELRARGVRPGDALGTRLGPSLSWFTLWLAAMRLGAWMVLDESGASSKHAWWVEVEDAHCLGGFSLLRTASVDRSPETGSQAGLAWQEGRRWTGVPREELLSQLRSSRPQSLVEVSGRWSSPLDLPEIVQALRGPEELHMGSAKTRDSGSASWEEARDDSPDTIPCDHTLEEPSSTRKRWSSYVANTSFSARDEVFLAHRIRGQRISNGLGGLHGADERPRALHSRPHSQDRASPPTARSRLC